jgi:hypothetical protein
MAGSYLGYRSANGVLSTRGKYTPGTNLWVVTFTTQIFGMGDADFEIWHGLVRGPGGQFLVYIDEAGYGAGQSGLINEYAPSGGAMYIRKGQEVSLNWSIGTGLAPQVWFYLRQPEVGRL